MKDIDNLIDQWTENIKSEDFSEPENMAEMVEKYKKKRKIGSIIGNFYLLMMLMFGLCVVMIISNVFNKIIMVVTILIFITHSIKFIRFQNNLEEQNPAVTVSDFVEERRKLTQRFYEMMKKWRYLVYPLSVVALINNILIALSESKLLLQISGILFVILMNGYLVYYIESGIREYREKLKAFN
ncbi:MAG: hypothetical protein A2381_19010 [Bdellovibrionales bacterium RIFOXYB1_FULL_37_110]|nr:MAG: hypothetical protein A2417_13090 [Bdellovibrionales bacterium RIFOXYC1_FULL_37_79]OFZ59883.1 MAG: hypothetical protein A2381_19010 [Bdellovibrionales bacterium RIFOXYB1_FULL_37_110]OFZ63504.1 MAG: hypothetical protein A2577_06460 [Bdellovibrionales bacterium RIFOXYD1_FULL_36_51]